MGQVYVSVLGYSQASIENPDDDDILEFAMNAFIVTIAEMKLQEYGIDRSACKERMAKDFEVLVDLIFRAAGYNRTGDVGKTQKTFDLDLISPVTGERCLVQVKSQSSLSEFEEDCKEFEAMKGYDKFFYVVHTHDESLIRSQKIESPVKVMLATDLAQVVIDSGLVRWLVSKLG